MARPMRKSDGLDLMPPGPIAYLMPEFPGQTHTWFDREVSHMREFGLDVRLFSTRPPPHESSARHAFAKRAREETTYLWPRSVSSILGAIGWALLTRPHRLVRAAACGLTLDEMSPRERIRTLPLVGAACVLARDARSADVQHLHVHSAARSTMIAMMTRRLTGLSFSLTLHGDLGWWGGGMGSKLRDAEFTVVVAEWLRDDILASYPDLRPNQILVGSMGVDTRKWVPEERLRENSSFQVATVARLHHAKGYDVLINAVARLRDSGRNIRLTAMGSGPEQATLQSLVRELGLDGAVDFAGSLSEDEVIRRLHAADAFVLASRSDPRPVVVMEALALGLPVIGTDAGGIPEIVTSERDGLIVPAEDADALARAIARLIDDPELRRRLSVNARRTAVERFDSRIGAAALYERLFGSLPPSAAATTS